MPSTVAYMSHSNFNCDKLFEINGLWKEWFIVVSNFRAFASRSLGSMHGEVKGSSYKQPMLDSKYNKKGGRAWERLLRQGNTLKGLFQVICPF